MILKVCGMREAENIRAVEATKPDAMGFIFYPRSPRYVSEVPAYLPGAGIRRVGVFVNASIETIAEKVKDFGLHTLQLHGDESPEYCQQLRQHFPGLRLIKAFSISKLEDLQKLRGFGGKVDLFLFDTPFGGFGGSGVKFDWTILDNYRGPTPFLLSGGISMDDVQQLREYEHPLFIGVDLNSRFETAPAIKDPVSLEQFFKLLRP